MKTRARENPFIILSAIAFLFGCSPEVFDYWAGLENNMDTGGDGDGDSDTDGDVDGDIDGDVDGDSDGDSDSESESEECNESENTCGDAGDDGSVIVWDGGPGDGGPDGSVETFCDSEAYANFLATVPHTFDNSAAPFLGNSLTPEVEITGFSYFS